MVTKMLFLRALHQNPPTQIRENARAPALIFFVSYTFEFHEKKSRNSYLKNTNSEENIKQSV